MITLLKAEQLKLRRSKHLSTILGCLAVFAGFHLLNIIRGRHETPGMYGVYVTTNMDFTFLFCFAAFAGFFAATEFQNCTIRNAISLGKSRLSIYLSKLIAVCAGAAAMLGLYWVIITIGCTAAFGFGTESFGSYMVLLVKTVPIQLLLFFALSSLFTMLAYITRSPIMTALLGAGYMFCSVLAPAMLSILFDGRYSFIVQFMPEYYIKGIEGADVWFILRGAGVGLAWAAITTFIGYMCFKINDVK